ncbi:uncharacterized protein BT62DRAFT_610108 [Guyanagaster necrorhizus]|uniref:BTB domain-containing protein n=1 Tax=Guyanagaster necrorhizus TaxID=856835 RepID=A0A9P8AW65_9AGAR|nr:uncharacterized protein BT62DRAFT_610108 [Guyanagaster necrorhizus MCA 3950]KAG7449841.1 hypothetical protein BT62DRAFT_610108 [Guyanagaster necrorhizus MCA 3950]
MNETKSSDQSTPVHDDVFYWENVVFLVENMLFNVPRYHFESFSVIFKTMFALPQGDSLNVDGSSDERPLILQGVTAQEFRSLLSVMLHPEPPVLTKEAWIAVLKLSNMWRLVNIRNIAIRQMSEKEISFVDKIIWGRDYKVVDWMMTGYGGLIDRGDVLSLDEGMRIGVQGVIGIWRSQDISRRNAGRYRRDTRGIVLEIFAEEIGDVQREEAEYNLAESRAPSRASREPSEPGTMLGW